MRIDPAGWPFVGSTLAFAAIATLAGSSVAGLILLVLVGFFLLFFRDPDRVVTQAAKAVLSPADGQVMVAGAPTGQQCPAGSWQQISIFLSPMDVHVNRMPVEGRVAKVRYHPGRFLPAYRHAASDLNEYTEVWVDHGGQLIVVRQIVGILARRIVCRAKENDQVQAGQRFGIMKFGSRMDVFVPTSAEIKVKVGDRAIGAVTIIAELRQ